MKSDTSVLATAQAVCAEVSRPNGKAAEKVLTVSLESACLGRAVVLRCQGRIIFRNDALGFSGLIYEVLPQARRMVVDLAAVQFLDSGALGELVLTHMWAEAAGYELRFSSPTEPVRQLLESANLVSILNIYSNVKSALDSMPQEEALPS
jgi:anti-anti-sigma factor